MTESNIPNELQHYLDLIGVRVAMSEPQEKPEVERDFTFKTPNFDENGEPDF